MDREPQSTQPSGGTPGLPIRALSVEVVEGPDAGRHVVAQSETLTVGTADGNDLVLTDPTVSRYHLDLVCREGGALVVDHGSTNGTLSGGVRIERAMVSPGALLSVGRTKLRVAEAGSVTVELHDALDFGALVGRTPAMRRLMASVRRAAQTDVPVLVVGESGTGKELVARALHDEGPRSRGPFVTVDCGSLSPTLVASELFGHEKGAFTGADRQHTGAFERASGGTLFLDEIGELSAALQPALLGALERRRFRRVGGRHDIEVDVRIVCATHRDLRAEVNAGAFRLDLYYRIAVVVLRVPALRERAEDIPLLVERFLREAGHSGPVEELFTPAAIATLCTHRWPGNVRELRNVVEATWTMGETPDMSFDMPASSPAGAPRIDAVEPTDLPYKEARRRVLEAFEARYLERLVAKARGNVSRAARDAQMDRSHLLDLLKRHGLK